MKQYIDKIRTLSQGIENTEVKMQLDSVATALDNEYTNIDSRLKLTTKQSIGRKEKLNDLYQKLSEMETLKLKLEQYQTQIGKLSKYRQAAVQQKKQYNSKIKTWFDARLSNQNSKDYAKYATIATQFNFQNDQDQSVLDNNRKTYQLLQLAGVFGNQKLIAPTINKPIATTPTKTTSRWNK